MALTDKDIIITPNIGSTNDPKINFVGASTNTGPSTITATVYPTNNGTLNFDGTEGSLFSIVNNLSTGSIFSVNPISGIPIIDVNANRTIALNPFGGNTGIGTTNPTSKLHVVGDALITGISTFSQLRIAGSTTSDLVRITQTGTGNALVVEDSTNPDTTPFVIDSSGRLLVGTATSVGAGGEVLQIVGTSPATSAIQVRGVGLTMTPTLAVARSRGTLATPTIVGNNDGLALLYFTGYDGSADIAAASIYAAVDGTPGLNNMPGRLVFSTTGVGASTPTERMRINSSGNVGIGTTNPTSQLQITGQFQSTQANSTADGGGQIYLNGATGNRIDFNINGVAAPTFTTRSAGTKIVLFPEISASNADYAFGIDNGTLWYSIPQALNTRQHRWYAGTTQLADLKGTGELVLGGVTTLTGTASQKLQVTGGAYVSGSVGIGITNPSSKLQVSDYYTTPTGGLDAGIKQVISSQFYTGLNILSGNASYIHFGDYSNADVGGLIYDHDNDFLRIDVNASERLRITSTGNVGIGTTNPLQKLHVLGNVLVAAGTSTGQHITQKPYELNGGTLSWEGTAGQLFSITNNLTSGSIFSVNDVSGIPSIDVDANGTIELGPYGGNVGLGTTNPTSKLHVAGGAYVSGSVGIGTTNPVGLTVGSTQTLHLNGDSAVLRVGPYYSAGGDRDNILLVASGTDSYIRSNNERFHIYNSVGDTLFHGSSDTETVRITSSGNVGIGTTNPYSKSHIVVTTSSTALLLNNTAGSGGSYVDLDFATYNVYQVGYANAPATIRVIDDGLFSGHIAFRTKTRGAIGNSSTEKVRIQSTGEVLIGTATSTGTASQTLQVTGGAYVSGNVGVGETNPASKLTVRSDSAGGRGGEISIVNYATSTVGNEAALNFGLENSTYNADNGNAQIKARVNNVNAATDMIFSSYNGSAFGERMRIKSNGATCIGISTEGTLSGDTVVAIGPNIGIISKSASNIATNGTVDININTGGGGYQGFLVVSNTNAAAAGSRTHTTFSVFGRGTDSSIQQIATDNGATSGLTFTVTTPSNGVIRVTNTSAATTTVNIQFFGGTST